MFVLTCVQKMQFFPRIPVAQILKEILILKKRARWMSLGSFFSLMSVKSGIEHPTTVS